MDEIKAEDFLTAPEVKTEPRPEGRYIEKKAYYVTKAGVLKTYTTNEYVLYKQRKRFKTQLHNYIKMINRGQADELIRKLAEIDINII